MGVFDSLFEESEDELKQEIKEAEETIKNAKEKLEKLKKKKKENNKKKETKVKAAKEKPKKVKNDEPKTSYTGLIVLVLVIIAAGLIYYYYYMPADTSHISYECFDTPMMGDGSMLLCLGVEYLEGSNNVILFKIQNLANDTAMCKLDVGIIQNSTTITRKIYGIGSLDGGQTFDGKFKLAFPEGESNIMVKPICE